MKKLLSLFFTFLILLTSPLPVRAQSASEKYVIDKFSSEITILQNTDLEVKETIEVNFPYPKHGIYRTIPVVYSAHAKTIRTKLAVVSVTDEKGNPYPYSRSSLGQSVNLKIGDPTKELVGENTYIIVYKISRIIQQYSDYDELYWNVTGSQWDTDILASDALVISPYAQTEKLDCYSGSVGLKDKLCSFTEVGNESYFKSETTLGKGSDFTIVVGLNKENDLLFPGPLEQFLFYLTDNWGYLAAIFPIIFLAFIWYQKGRDTCYISSNIYFTPDDKKAKKVSLFERKMLPFVYHPITNLTPSEVGTIVDERVHISDVIAEILELARLGFLSIRKVEKKKLIGSDIEYLFVKEKKFDDKQARLELNDYQDLLLKEIFRSKLVSSSTKQAENLLAQDSSSKDLALKNILSKKEFVLLSKLKNQFYESLSTFKNKLYERMKERSIFAGNPEKVRITWFVISIIIQAAFGSLVLYFSSTTYNYFPLLIFVFGMVGSVIFTTSMPRKTAEGYSYFRQIKGLKYYLKLGKWRFEVAEKQLFIEEMLPLAVALGVVDKLTQAMKDLEIAPPSYFAGSTIYNFEQDIDSFSSSAQSAFLSSPSGSLSGSSSWSGGSGFSGGGSSGGGFGGGGGGSW